jgi:hypothetical protein
VMKTNWVTQTVPRVVQVDLPAASAAAETAAPVETAGQKEVSTESPSPAPSTALVGPVVLEAARTAQPPRNEQVEVQLRIRGNGAASRGLQVQQWRVEREDRTILCFGQDQDFKRELPAGKYKVEVKLRQGEGSPLLTIRGTLVLSAQEAVIQQNLAANR